MSNPSLETEKELLKNKCDLIEILENTLDMVSKVNKDGIFQYVTLSHKDILGYDIEELVGTSGLEFIHPDDKPRVAGELSDLINIGTGKSSIYRFRHKDGHYLWMETIGKRLFDESGKVTGAVFSSRDITRHIEVQNALKKSEKKFKKLFNKSNDTIFVHKLNSDGLPGMFIDVNDTACTRLGYSREEILSMHISEINPEFDPEKAKKVGNLLQEKGQMVFPAKNKTKYGEVIPVENNSIFFDLYGENVVLTMARDMRERIKAEQSLNEAIEYDKLKTEFFANISHELRTPLNVILGVQQLLNLKLKEINNEDIVSPFKKYTDIMKQNCYRLLRLVNNLIDVTKIDAGYFEINPVNYDIVKVVEDITLSIVDYVENKGIDIIFDTNVEEKIMAFDPDKIERILLNLISNSIKFTKQGGSITVNLIDKGDLVTISVKDTGIGIPKEKQKQIFDRFIQVDKSLTRKQEGSGIGLSLVKSLVEMHNGQIIVMSEENVGSEFVIELPVNLVNNETYNPNECAYVLENNIEKIQIEFSDIYL